jgi:hypothetical protein
MALYIYAIRHTESPKIKAKGMDGAGVYTIPYKDVEAVVSDVDIQKYGSKEIAEKAKEDVSWIVEHANIHESVIEQANRAPTSYKLLPSVIPMKFGTIFDAKEKVEVLLKKKYKKFQKTLQSLQGKQEWSVKVYVDPATLKNEIKKEDTEIQKKLAELKKLPKGMDYFLELEIEEKLTSLVDKKCSTIRGEITKQLLACSTETKEGRLIAKDVTGKSEDMILNTACLVDYDAFAIFQKKTKELEEEKNNILSIVTTGPWPPYNFV